ncbi:MAG: alpha/beta fold hydrolase [Terriglobia bacterium]
MPYVTTAVGRLHVEEEGAGPAVVLWPSLFCDASLWRHQVDELARDHRLLLVEGPGHGRSEPRRTSFTLEDCARATVEILDAAGLDRAVLAGLSWGGMTFMRVALQAPERVAALVLIDTSADAERPLEGIRIRALELLFRRFGFLHTIERAILKALVGRTARRERPEIAADLASRFRQWNPEGLAHAVRAVILDRKSILHDLARISCPTLVIVGEEDKVTPPACSERIARRIPGARLVRIPRAGHLSALEAPTEVNRALREFLD